MIEKFCPIHVFRIDEDYYCVDIKRAKSFIVPSIIGSQLLKHTSENGKVPINKLTPDALWWLREKKLLVNELVFPIEPFREPLSHSDIPEVMALFLNITEDCNLKCSYCIVEDTYLKNVVKMKEDIIQRAIDQFMENTKLTKVEIHYFGGEPLTNPEAIKTATKYALQKGKTLGKEPHFVISTNGVLLNDMWLDYFVKYKFTVLLSFDGPQEVQDSNRSFSNGHGSFSIIVKNAKRLVEVYKKEGLEYAARAIATGENPDFMPSVKFLNNMGFDSICVSPVAVDTETECYMSETKMAIFYEANKRFVDRHIEGEKTNRPCRSMNLLLFIQKVAAETPIRHFCWAGLESVTVSPSGVYYPCFNWAGLDGDIYNMGHVDKGLQKDRQLKYIQDVAVDAVDKCTECWARYLCSGGCSACSTKFCNCINGIADDKLRCQYFKHQLEMAIYAKENQ